MVTYIHFINSNMEHTEGIQKCAGCAKLSQYCIVWVVSVTCALRTERVTGKMLTATPSGGNVSGLCRAWEAPVLGD